MMVSGVYFAQQTGYETRLTKSPVEFYALRLTSYLILLFVFSYSISHIPSLTYDSRPGFCNQCKGCFYCIFFGGAVPRC